jgi:hypothetical protein
MYYLINSIAIVIAWSVKYTACVILSCFDNLYLLIDIILDTQPMLLKYIWADWAGGFLYGCEYIQ